MEFRKILVPVYSIEVDAGAMELACRLLAKKDRGEICAVYVIPIARNLPLDAEVESEIKKGENVLDQMEVFAKELGCRVEADLLQAREVGPSIVDEAVARGVDLILLSLTYKRRFGQFSLGDVVPHVLKNARCRVIIYHQPTT